MGHENGGKQKPTKRRHVQGMLDETDPLTLDFEQFLITKNQVAAWPSKSSKSDYFQAAKCLTIFS